jgi:hypothetical protein
MSNLFGSFGWHCPPSPPPHTISIDNPSSSSQTDSNTSSCPPQTVVVTPAICYMARLPEELIHQIFASIDPPIKVYSSPPRYNRMHNLSRVCRVSKQFRRIATPLLYTSVERGLHDTNFAKLLVTLAAEPGLCQYIRSIRQKPGAKYDYDAMTHVSRFSEEGSMSAKVAPIVLSATRLRMPYVQSLITRWLQQEDIVLALCAFHAPNIECLVVNPGAPKPGLPFESILLQAISRSALGLPYGKIHSFKRLRVLYLDFSAYTYFPASNALPLLLLPSLEDLTLAAWGKLPFGWDRHDAQHAPFGQDWTWPRRASPIKKLSLLYPRVDPATASKMILACKALVKFETTNHLTPIGGRHGWYGLISAALLEHAGTLRELSIGERSSEMTEIGYHGRLWCARSLINLRYLRVPYHVLVGRACIEDFRNMVPTSLRHLIISLPKGLRCQETAPSGESSHGDLRFPNLTIIELHQKSIVESSSHEGWSKGSVWFLDEFRKLFITREREMNRAAVIPHIILDMRHVRHYCEGKSNHNLPPALFSRFTEDLTWCMLCKIHECCAARVQYASTRSKANKDGCCTKISLRPDERSEEEIVEEENRGY